MALTDELRTMLRLQREIMTLSPAMRRALLSELPQDDSPPQEQPNQPAARRGVVRKKRGQSNGAVRRGRKVSGGSVKAQAVKFVLGAARPLFAADVIAALKERDPDVRANAIYTGLHEAAEAGQISKEMVGQKARYSRPGGKRHAPAAPAAM